MKIKLLSFNIQHCRNFITKKIDIDSVVNLIKKTNADIVGLNEVYGKYDNNEAQYIQIANKLGFYYYFGQTITWRGIPYGNALLSKFKLKNPETIMIPDPMVKDNNSFETRAIIKSEFEDLDLTALVTHFGLNSSEQENALKTTLDTLSNIKNKYVFMGDLNMEPTNEKIKTIKNILIDTVPFNGPTFPSDFPTRKIDYIFISKDITLIDAKIIKKIVSDHLAHYAEIKL